MNRPQYLNDRHIACLASMEEAQISNMFYAVPFVLGCCPDISVTDAQEVIRYWLSREVIHHPPVAVVA